MIVIHLRRALRERAGWKGDLALYIYIYVSYVYIHTYVQIPTLLLHGVQSPSFVLDMDEIMMQKKWIKRFKQVRMTMKTCQHSLGDVLESDNFQVF